MLKIFTIVLLILALLQLTFSYNCEPDQYFNGQRCAPCQENCICNAQGNCDSCVSGYTFDETFSNCVACPIATDDMHVGCAQCCYQISGTTFLCSQCPNLSDTFLIGGQCLRVIGCSNLDQSGRCNTCKDGYYLQNGICVQCDPSCSTCIDPTFCLSCSIGHFANNAINYGLCQSCSLGCATCTDSSTCTGCLTGYQLSGGACSVCSSLCKTCTSSGCTSCISSAALIGNDCVECSDENFGGTPGCQSCTAEGSVIKCTTCADSYFLTSSKTCQGCNGKFANSYLCTSTQVIQCKSDYSSVLQNRYHKMGNQCVLNTKSCKAMSDSSGKCESCYFEDGYYYRLESGTCLKCEQTGCFQFSSTTCECTACMDQYQYVNTQCIACQNPHCYKCQSSVTLCQACEPYYGLISSACISCTQLQCLNCDGDTSLCNQCLDHYYISDGACYLCQDSCQTCTSSTQCTVCKEGYYLHENGRCKRLPSSCSTVDENGVCQKCKYGYMLKFNYCFPCSPEMFNLNECDKFCPSYYARLTFEKYGLPFWMSSLLILALFYQLF